MSPFSLKHTYNLEDIITQSIILLALLILFISMWVLYRTFGREKLWLVALIGITFYLTGTALDLLDEFFRLPEVISCLLDNVLIDVGIAMFSLGMVMIVHDLINQASVDSMTGLYNKRYLKKVLDQEIERARRYKHQLSLLFIDVNGFKRINDQMGHTAGDLVLRQVALKIKETVRKMDVLARYGGDEFVLLMPEADSDGAEILLKRLQEVVSRLEVPGGCKIGISAGIATFPGDGGNADMLIDVADRRMYLQKVES